MVNTYRSLAFAVAALTSGGVAGANPALFIHDELLDSQPVTVGVDLGRGDLATVALEPESNPISLLRRAPATLAPSRRRSRGPQAKPKRRSNRLTIRKRVRRKHRRAA